MQKILMISLRYTLVTTLLLGLGYPLLVTLLAQHLWTDKANGELIFKNGTIIGSHWIGQSFSGPQYFHSRPSAAGNGYDATASGGSNWSPSNQKFVDRVTTGVQAEQAKTSADPVPVDLVTASASGLDPDITPAAAEYQAQRIALARKLTTAQVETLIQKNLQERQFGLFGERRVNVLQLNLDLDSLQSPR
uniref:Potassium-transporting ATPase C chain (Potassium-translocating ATPase C chain) (ATP phosphohydrolase (Potassium-transporting) C chain) (Potassium-binding and translocating subunit C) n=1 Tax=mine drainage metagenome TaxID=410659 RepID=E6QKX2_9ZZZZ